MSTSAVVQQYFAALAARDVDAAVACWARGGVDRFVGQRALVAPEGVREYFAALFAAFPDFRFEVLEQTTAAERSVVRWRARATFAGPGQFEGLEANGAVAEFEGCDVLTVSDDRIVANHAYIDTGDVARQLGVLPPVRSRAHARLTALANARTRVRRRLSGVPAEPVADGVWVVHGGFPRTMNVYLLADDGGVTVFDAGIHAMTSAVAAAAARLGGIRRVVLGHADADHRGAAAGLRAPVFCHAAERAAAESPHPYRDYWDFAKLDAHGRMLMPRLIRGWDGGALDIEGTVDDSEEIAGFRVLALPGHAPGLIGLFREADRLALVSDCIYTLDPQSGRKRPAGVPHPAFNHNTEQARASIRALAALQPAAVWPGHADPVTGDVGPQLQRAAAGA